MIIITYLWALCIPLHEGYKDLQANIRNLFSSIPNEFPPSDKRPPKKPGKRKKSLENVREVIPRFSLSHPPTDICWYTHPCSNLLLSFTILWLLKNNQKKKNHKNPTPQKKHNKKSQQKNPQQSVNKKPENAAISGTEVNQPTSWCCWNYTGPEYRLPCRHDPCTQKDEKWSIMEIHMEYRKGTLLGDEVGSSLEYENSYVTVFFCLLSYV